MSLHTFGLEILKGLSNSESKIEAHQLRFARIFAFIAISQSRRLKPIFQSPQSISSSLSNPIKELLFYHISHITNLYRSIFIYARSHDPFFDWYLGRRAYSSISSGVCYFNVTWGSFFVLILSYLALFLNLLYLDPSKIFWRIIEW